VALLAMAIKSMGYDLSEATVEGGFTQRNSD